MKKLELSPIKVTLDKERSLKFNMKAVLSLNEELDRNVLGEGGLFDDEKNIDLKAVAAALAHGLRHEDADLTTEKVLDMVDVRQLSQLAEKLAEAFGAVKDQDANPTKPKDD